MINQLILVGRIVNDIKLEEVGEKKIINLTIAVKRCFKNMEGIYETDFINCKLFNFVADYTNEYCKKGDVIGIKGRIQNINGKLEVIAEKVTFLSNKKDNK